MPGQLAPEFLRGPALPDEFDHPPPDAGGYGGWLFGILGGARHRATPWRAGTKPLRSNLCGEVAANADPLDVEAATQFYREATEVAADLGMRPSSPTATLGLGKLYRRTSKREQEQEHLAAATTMYREMDMRFWLEQAEASCEI
jgi:hypothetical protein